jgi:hypothetical protein
VPDVPRDFVEIEIPCPLAAPDRAPRFVALYPMYDGQFAVHEGRAVHSHDGDEAGTSRWLRDALGYDSAVGTSAVVVDLATRRAWRAPVERAIGLVIEMRAGQK